ncbi:hypothetical protein PR002_g22221 [Phytophthora rubi]|uniref:PH domain-containing protein n=1 Tax=Phytophthora rubi TaxID=129364 RepID=A0A6A3IYC8_9STRA|nr:hypothetical protein PR002_g22221 [Phytophthora rubi]
MPAKSGKLHKLGSGFFGPKWTEKWVHLDGTVLKCFPMAVEQQVFSLGSSRQSNCYELLEYKFALADEKKVNRKFTFQLESIEKSSKVVTFACASEKELAEWKYTLTSRLCLPADAHVSPVVTEKIRRAAEAFKEIDPRNTGKIEAGKLHGLLQTISFHNYLLSVNDESDSELVLMQQQLDLGRHGIITRTRLLTWLQSYYCAQEVMDRVKAERLNNQIAAENRKPPEQRDDSISIKTSARVSASKRLLSLRRDDWNQKYYALRSKEPSDDVLAVGSEVSAFFAEFRQAAESLVGEIVAEMVLDDSEKTLQPQPLDDDEIFATDGVHQYSAMRDMLLKYEHDGLLVYLCSNNQSNVSSQEKRESATSMAMFHRMAKSTDDDVHHNIDPATARALAKLALQEEASQVTVEFFNLVLGISSPDSKAFWEERILPQVQAKFGLSREALNLDTMISEDLLHLPQLFHALQFQTGVYFSDNMNYNFKGAEPLALEYIQSICPTTVLLARTSTECERVLESSDAYLAAGQFSSALSGIMFHISILETAPSDERNLSLCHLLTCAANISLAMNLRDQAKQLAILAIEDSPSNHAELTRAYTVLMKLKHAAGDLAGAQEYFATALEPIQWHLGPVHPLLCDTYMTMSEILGDLGEPEQAVEILQSCVALVRDCFGKTSLLYADIRRQQGMLMYAANPKDGEAIIGVLEDAFSVYEKHFQDPVEDIPVYKDFAAECCYMLANLRTQVSGVQAAEAAYGIALTGLGLRKEVLPPDHEDMMRSYLQLASLSRDLGELYRAVDYYKPGLSILKTIRDDEHIDQIRSVTQAMLQLHLQTLSLEKRSTVDKTAKRYAQQWPRFALLSRKMLPDKSAAPEDDVGEESALLIFVMKNLFQLEPIEYFEQLIEKTDLEFQDYRKQYNLNFAGTLRRTNADAPSPQHAMLRSSSGRFASFSGAGTFSPPGSPRPPLSPMHHPTLFSPSSRSGGRTSFNQLDCNFLKTTTGEFTFGGQLATVLFLIDLPAAGIDTPHLPLPPAPASDA